jgi:hypothetical protein
MPGKAPKQQDLEQLAASLGATVAKKGTAAAADWVVRGIGAKTASAASARATTTAELQGGASSPLKVLSEGEWWQELERRGWDPSTWGG